MEIELKYLIDDDKKIDQLFEDELIQSIKDEKEEERIPMDAVYYDTAGHNLTKEGIAFRIRKEGNWNIATLKWNGTSENGMHKRQEINVPIADDEAAKTPDLDVFSQSEMSEVLESIVGTEQLVPLMKIVFLRRQIRLDSGKSISVFSVDSGKIQVGNRERPISELEIELYSGSEEDMRAIGDKISEKYGLIAGNKSKFERGYELI